jgi:hypothetical protein
VKLCKDCRWFRREVYFQAIKIEGDRCVHDKGKGHFDLVRGEQFYFDPYAMRASGRGCGPDGELWEAIPPPPPIPRRWWQFWRPQIRRWRCDGGCGGKCPQCNGGPE